MSKESGAISLLKRAVELDGKKQWTSALVCYKEGLQMLMEVKKFIKAFMQHWFFTIMNTQKKGIF